MLYLLPIVLHAIFSWFYFELKMMGPLCNTFTLDVLKNCTKMITKYSPTFDIKSFEYIFVTHAGKCPFFFCSKMCAFLCLSFSNTHFLASFFYTPKFAEHLLSIIEHFQTCYNIMKHVQNIKKNIIKSWVLSIEQFIYKYCSNMGKEKNPNLLNIIKHYRTS